MSETTAFQERPLRFIHASDIHLERTIEGVAECPVHWEQQMLDISLKAAQRLFQKCIEEEIDFLVLSGNVFNANVSPPGIFLFLTEQFDRLKKAGIAVYWAGGEFDSPEDMPTAFPMPENVYRFPSNSIQEFYFNRTEGMDSLPVAKLVGMSRNQRSRRIRSSEFPADPGGLFTIAVVNGDVDPDTLTERHIDYWAMGGTATRHTFYGNPPKKGPDGKPLPADPHLRRNDAKRDRKDLPPQPYIVHYPGATLARTPVDIGTYGATLVEVVFGEDGLGDTQKMLDTPMLSCIPTSPIRWVNDRIVLDANADGGKLADELHERIKAYKEAQKGDALFINWLVDIPPGQLASRLRNTGLSNDLLSELRTMYGQEETMTWSVSISVLVPEELPKSFYEQQTILGDFLRSVKHHQDNPQQIIHLGRYIPKKWEHAETSNLLLAEEAPDEITDVDVANSESGKSEKGEPEERWIQTSVQAEMQQEILREAAMTGLELFSQHNRNEV